MSFAYILAGFVLGCITAHLIMKDKIRNVEQHTLSVDVTIPKSRFIDGVTKQLYNIVRDERSHKAVMEGFESLRQADEVIDKS